MADPIVVKVGLDTSGVQEGAQEITRKIQNALDVGLRAAREVGQKIGQALSVGIEAGRAHTAAEASERAHQQRIEAIHAQSAARIQEIEARKQAQLEIIRERALQREIEQQRKLERAAQSGAGNFQAFLRRYSSTIREAGESIQQAGFAAVAFTDAIVGLGRAAFQSAIQLDQQVNVLKALTGSAEAAEKRFAKLVELSQKTPGLTTGLALTLDAQLRTLNVREQTINRVLPAIGRLNAVAPLGDPTKFSQNLVQLITQNFEKQDLKELVGQSPLAGELIKQIFSVDSPTNAKAIREAAKKLGITTVEGFFDEFARAAAENPKLRNITESLGTQFEKLKDRIIVALRPLGLTIIQSLEPLIESLVPVIERVSKAFASLPEGVRQLIVILGGVAAALGPVLIAIGAAIQTFGALGNIITAVAGAGGVATLIEAFGPFIPVILAVAAAIGALVTAFVTDFGGIRTVVFDVLNFINSQFGFVKQAFVDNRAEIELLKVQFGVFSEEVKPIVKALGELFKNTFELAIKGAIIVAKSALEFFNDQLALTITSFRLIKSLLGEIANAGVKAADFLTPGLGLGTAARNRFNAATQARASTFAPGLNNENDPGQALNQLVDDLKRLGELDPNRKKNTGAVAGSGSEKASAARALRDAQIAFVKDQAENELKTVKDINERGVRELKEIYEQNKITVREFFEFKLNLQKDSLDQELRLLDGEAAAITETLKSAKGPELIRDQAKLNDVLTRQALKRKEILDITEATGREFKKSTPLSPITAEEVPVIDREAEQRDRRVADLRRQAAQFDVIDLEIRRQELQIQDAVARGALTEGEARQAMLAVERQFRDERLKSLQAQERPTTDPKTLAQIRLQVEQVQRLGVEFSNTERFARGFNSAIGTVGDAFERFGQNVSRAFGNVRDLFGGLKQAVLGFFNDLLGQSLQNLVRQTLGGLFGNISGSLGGIFGSGNNNLFRTPSFVGSASGNVFQSLTSAFAGAAGGGISLPASVTPTVLGSVPGTFGGVLPRPNPGFQDALRAGGIGTFGGGAAAATAPAAGFSFGALSKSLGAAAPFLGLSIGSSLGGQSLAGNILGGIGGALGGLVAGAATGGITGGLGSAFALSGTLGPIALAAAPLLLVGGFLLGKAKQRRADEEASGQFLTQALQSIEQLAAGISADQIDGSQARAMFDNQILGTFRQQISSLKTESVRKSRLTNQVRDLEKVYQDRIPPLIDAQQQRRANAARFASIDSRLVPQFAGGGLVPGVDRGRDSVLALLRPGELVLTRNQQFLVMAQSNPGVFDRAGVPSAGISVGPAQAFQGGGTAQLSSFTQSSEPMVINLAVQVGMTEGDAQQILARAVNRRTGQNIIINVIDKVQTRRS